MGLTKEYKEWSTKARIRQIETGIGNRQLADMLKLSRQHVTAVVNGKKGNSYPTIHKISKILDMELPGYEGR